MLKTSWSNTLPSRPSSGAFVHGSSAAEPVHGRRRRPLAGERREEQHVHDRAAVVVAVRPEPVDDAVERAPGMEVREQRVVDAVHELGVADASVDAVADDRPPARSGSARPRPPASSRRWRRSRAAPRRRGRRASLASSRPGVGFQSSNGLGVPPGVITRAQFSQMSTWLFVSPRYGRIWGCVPFTWNASQNASCAIFQFAGSITGDVRLLVHGREVPHLELRRQVARRTPRTDAASRSGLTKTKPAHVPTLASGRWKVSSLDVGEVPSRRHVLQCTVEVPGEAVERASELAAVPVVVLQPPAAVEARVRVRLDVARVGADDEERHRRRSRRRDGHLARGCPPRGRRTATPASRAARPRGRASPRRVALDRDVVRAEVRRSTSSRSTSGTGRESVSSSSWYEMPGERASSCSSRRAMYPPNHRN